MHFRFLTIKSPDCHLTGGDWSVPPPSPQRQRVNQCIHSKGTNVAYLCFCAAFRNQHVRVYLGMPLSAGRCDSWSQSLSTNVCKANAAQGSWRRSVWGEWGFYFFFFFLRGLCAVACAAALPLHSAVKSAVRSRVHERGATTSQVKLDVS